MKKDKNGCSKTQCGQENYEYFYSEVVKRKLIQYEYRNELGLLFTCVARDLEQARIKRDNWIKNN